MKRYFTFIFMAISALVGAQNRLTNREIFDFNVGDEFQYQYYYENGGYQYLILDKKPISGTDSIVYEVQKVRYKFTIDFSKTPPQKVYEFYKDTITLDIPHLDAFVDIKYNVLKHVKPDSCVGYSDSFQYSDFYGIPSFHYQNMKLCEFEGSTVFEEFCKGIGRTHYRILDPRGPYQFEEEMKFYRKGSNSKGKYDDAYQLGINEPVLNASQIGIYPNPGKSVISFTRSFKFGSPYTITDAVGKIIAYGNLTSETIDISALTSGLYFFNINENDHLFFGKFMKN